MWCRHVNHWQDACDALLFPFRYRENMRRVHTMFWCFIYSKKRTWTHFEYKVHFQFEKFSVLSDTLRRRSSKSKVVLVAQTQHLCLFFVLWKFKYISIARFVFAECDFWCCCCRSSVVGGCSLSTKNCARIKVLWAAQIFRKCRRRHSDAKRWKMTTSQTPLEWQWNDEAVREREGRDRDISKRTKKMQNANEQQSWKNELCCRSLGECGKYSDRMKVIHVCLPVSLCVSVYESLISLRCHYSHFIKCSAERNSTTPQHDKTRNSDATIRRRAKNARFPLKTIKKRKKRVAEAKAKAKLTWNVYAHSAKDVYRALETDNT